MGLADKTNKIIGIGKMEDTFQYKCSECGKLHNNIDIYHRCKACKRVYFMKKANFPGYKQRIQMERL